MDLCVVGVLMVLYAVVCDDVGHQAAVDCKQPRSKQITGLSDSHEKLTSPPAVVA